MSTVIERVRDSKQLSTFVCTYVSNQALQVSAIYIVCMNNRFDVCLVK